MATSAQQAAHLNARTEFILHLCWVVSEDSEDEQLWSVKGADNAQAIVRILNALVDVVRHFSTKPSAASSPGGGGGASAAQSQGIIGDLMVGIGQDSSSGSNASGSFHHGITPGHHHHHQGSSGGEEMVVEAGVRAIGRLGELKFEPKILGVLRSAIANSPSNMQSVRIAALESLSSLLLKQSDLLYVRQQVSGIGSASDVLGELEAVHSVVLSQLDGMSSRMQVGAGQQRHGGGISNGASASLASRNPGSSGSSSSRTLLSSGSAREELGLLLRLRVILAPLRIQQASIRSNESFEIELQRQYFEAFQRVIDTLFQLDVGEGNAMAPGPAKIGEGTLLSYSTMIFNFTSGKMNPSTSAGSSSLSLRWWETNPNASEQQQVSLAPAPGSGNTAPHVVDRAIVERMAQYLLEQTASGGGSGSSFGGGGSSAPGGHQQSSQSGPQDIPLIFSASGVGRGSSTSSASGASSSSQQDPIAAQRQQLRERFPPLCICFAALFSDELFSVDDIPKEAFDLLCLVLCRCLRQVLLFSFSGGGGSGTSSSSSAALVAGSTSAATSAGGISSVLLDSSNSSMMIGLGGGNSMTNTSAAGVGSSAMNLRSSAAAGAGVPVPQGQHGHSSLLLDVHTVQAVEILCTALTNSSARFPVCEVALPILVDTVRRVRIEKQNFVVQVCNALNTLIGTAANRGREDQDIAGRLKQLQMDQIISDWIRCYPEHKKIQREAFLSLGLVCKSATSVLSLMQTLNFSFHSSFGACAALSDMSRCGYTYSATEANQALAAIQSALQLHSSRSRSDNCLEAEAEICLGLIASKAQRRTFLFPKDSAHYVETATPQGSPASGSMMNMNNVNGDTFFQTAMQKSGAMFASSYSSSPFQTFQQQHPISSPVGSQQASLPPSSPFASPTAGGAQQPIGFSLMPTTSFGGVPLPGMSPVGSPTASSNPNPFAL
ncbi:unnamed protein product [Amoebophrya sp. A25]|nr:unnamed protein product [Amoebophrya sp. A25]|eukprot:GSA25T00017383001.1